MNMVGRMSDGGRENMRLWFPTTDQLLIWEVMAEAWRRVKDEPIAGQLAETIVWAWRRHCGGLCWEDDGA